MRIVTAIVLSSLAGASVADDLLWIRIQTESNIVVLTRHMQSTGGKALAWDESGGCKGEAQLTAEGRAEARRLGEEFSARAIKPFVISSPMCRCRETAGIAFGEALTDADLREIASADTA